MPYIPYLIPLILSLALSLIFTSFVRKLAFKNNWAIAKPRVRDSHQKPTPRLGGVAVFLSFWIVAIIYWIFFPQELYFINEQIFGFDKNLLGVFLASIIWIIVGIIDDLRGINPWKKFFWQGVCGLIIVGFGINIWWISNPIGGLNIVIGNWNWFLVPAWIGLLMNVVNWIDGVDGLASGISIIALVILFILSIFANINQPATALLCAILAGAILGFLFFNWHPAKIFLGDSGSMFIGLMLGVISIIFGAKLATLALVMGIPILDALWVIVQRLGKKKAIWSADKIHLHHRFIDAGLTIKQTVVILYSISAAFGIVALGSKTPEKMTAIWYLVVIMAIIVIGLKLIKTKKQSYVSFRKPTKR